MADAHEAFAARMLLAQAAERTLDVQYYIARWPMRAMRSPRACCWRRPPSAARRAVLHLARRPVGHACCSTRCARAAERGVRVRLLLDDNNTAGLDATLAALDAHPEHRGAAVQPVRRSASRAARLPRPTSRALNRRMHNKSFTADNQATIIGGRNVGDEYFGADRRRAVRRSRRARGRPGRARRLGAISTATGPATRPIRPTGCCRRPTPGALAQLAARPRTRRAASPTRRAYLDAVRESPFVQRADRRPAAVRMGGHARWSATIRPRRWAAARADGSLLPRSSSRSSASRGASWTWSRRTSCRRGRRRVLRRAGRSAACRCAILTNSLEATDVAAVHAGYAKRRKALLEAGVDALRTQAPSRRRPRRSGDAALARQLRLEPACQDLRGRPQRASSSARSTSIRARRG